MAIKNILGLLTIDTDADEVRSSAVRFASDGFTNYGGGTERTISSGAITATSSFHRIDTEADAATDDLDTINGGTTGDILLLKPASSTRDITIKDGTGNIQCGGDQTLTSVNSIAMLINFGGTYFLVAIRNN